MTSVVWKYFTQVIEDNKIVGAICNNETCKKRLSNSTSGLANHLKKHKIDVKLGQPNQSTDQNDQVQITKYFQSANQDTMEALISRLCVKDGIAFRTIAHSEDLQSLIKLRFKSTPTSPNTVRKCVISYANNIKELYKVQLQKSLSEVGLLSFGFDEWTSIQNKRYMSLIVFSDKTMWSLGLIPIIGSTNARISSEEISERLLKFGLSLKNMSTLMSDGASINHCIAKKCNLGQQFGTIETNIFFHFVHFGLQDVDSHSIGFLLILAN